MSWRPIREWGAVGAEELSAMLWRERRQLELLLFRLETQLAHARTGNWHWLKFTAADIENVLENLRFETLARSIESSSLAVSWHAPAASTLPAIASVAPAGIWPELLQEHHLALVLLFKQIETAASANIQVLGSGPREAGDSIAGGSGGSVAGSSVAGVAVPQETAADAADDVMLLAQNANIERALAATRECSLPLLQEFLGLA